MRVQQKTSRGYYAPLKALTLNMLITPRCRHAPQMIQDSIAIIFEGKKVTVLNGLNISKNEYSVKKILLACLRFELLDRSKKLKTAIHWRTATKPGVEFMRFWDISLLSPLPLNPSIFFMF